MSRLVRFYESELNRIKAKMSGKVKEIYDRAKSAILPKKDTRTAAEGFDDALATFRKHVATPIPAKVVKAWRDDLQSSDSYNDGHDGFFDVFNMWVTDDPEGRAWKVKNDKTGKQFLF